MELLNDVPIPNAYSGVALSLVAVFILVVVFKKRSELSWHALSNMFASIVVTALNLAMVWLFVHDINGWMQAGYQSLNLPTLPADFWDGFPFLVVVLLGIAAKDFVDYWNHRLMHTKWVWPTHAAHHSDTHVNAFTTWRIHFLEALVMSGSYIVLLTWLQMPNAIPIVATFFVVHNIYVHMDLEIEHGPLKLLVASPIFHRWHHADVPEAYGKNLANVMPVWDYVFGTYYNPGPCRAPLGALSSGIEDKNPISIYVYPIFEWARLLRGLWPKGRNALVEQRDNSS